MIREIFYLGLLGVVAITIIGVLGYFLIYRKLMGGKKRLTKRELIVGAALIGYILMVIGVTLLNRGEGFPGRVNFHFLSSYREAWNIFSVRNWQLIILNILMFVPLGILLPLIHEKFRQFKWTIGVACCFTLFIELVQYFTRLGIFELDDLFNNVLGAIIGYGVIMSILTIFGNVKNKWSKIVAYLSPLILVVALFISIFTYYRFQEFGNLSIAYNYKINMKDVKMNVLEDLKNESEEAPIYKAADYHKDSAKEFAIHFFENQGISTDDLEIIDYDNSVFYRASGNSSFSLWLNYLDGSYTYTDFSAFDENVEMVATNEETLIEGLSKFNIQVPANAVLMTNDVGHYEWALEKELVGDTLTRGTLTCHFYDDGTIKKINNQMITYSKVRNVSLKSVTQAFEELKKGKFQLFNFENQLESIEIKKVDLDYYLDSKGYYQPVYSFDSIVNGIENQIVIPAIQ